MLRSRPAALCEGWRAAAACNDRTLASLGLSLEIPYQARRRRGGFGKPAIA